jgi:hypothetical protein
MKHKDWARSPPTTRNIPELGRRNPERPETALLDAFVLPPGVIVGEVDVVPMDRRHMPE